MTAATPPLFWQFKTLTAKETAPRWIRHTLPVAAPSTAVPKGTPPDVVAVLKMAAKAAAEDPAFREALGKLSLGLSYADADAFRSAVQQDHAFFKQLIPKIGLRA